MKKMRVVFTQIKPGNSLALVRNLWTVARTQDWLMLFWYEYADDCGMSREENAASAAR